MSSSEPTAPVPTAAQFRAAQQSEEFTELRRAPTVRSRSP